MNRLDVYTAVHKMHRARLFSLTVEAGKADPADTVTMTRLAAAVDALAAELAAHAGHEDRFIHPLLRQNAPSLAALLDAAHAALDTRLSHLRQAAAAAATGQATDPNALYRALAAFTAAYLEHLAVEEGKALPALWDGCTDEELSGILASFRGSRSDAENLTSLVAQLATLSPPEIQRMISAGLGPVPACDVSELLATILDPRQLGALRQPPQRWPAAHRRAGRRTTTKTTQHTKITQKEKGTVKHQAFFNSARPALAVPAGRRAAAAASALGLCAVAILTATGTAHAATSAPAKTTPPLAVVTTYLSPAAAQASYKGQLAATGGTKPYSWSIDSGALPAGLTLNPGTGAITGKPSWTGTFDFTAEVTDSEATPVSATQAESITVTAPALSVTTASLPAATYGVSYSQKLAAAGGISPYTWTLSAGSLPEGLTLKPDGTITGKPKATGTFTFTAEVADSDSPSETATVSLSITAGVAPLAITTTSLPGAGENQQTYDVALTASGGAGKYTWQVISGSLPNGLRLLPSGAFTVAGFSGITGSGTYQFQVQVTDSELPAQSATATLQIQVTDGNLP